MSTSIVVQLGSLTDDPIVVGVNADVIDGFDPDQVFIACNRIGTVSEDMAELPTSWQRNLRRRIDTVEAPSMSVGDTVILTSQSGLPIGGWKCAAHGWVEHRPSRLRPTINMEQS